MTGDDVPPFDRLADVQSRWNVLEHPFYASWSAGELTREELSWYAQHVDLWDAFAHAVEADLTQESAEETAECAAAWTAAGDALASAAEPGRNFGGPSGFVRV